MNKCLVTEYFLSKVEHFSECYWIIFQSKKNREIDFASTFVFFLHFFQVVLLKNFKLQNLEFFFRTNSSLDLLFFLSFFCLQFS